MILMLGACNLLIKTPVEEGCAEAAESFSSCSDLSGELETPYEYDTLIVASVCDGQPACLSSYFSCVADAFSSADCSTEEGANAALASSELCMLPEEDPETCPIAQFLPDEECGGIAPTIQEVTCTYNGMQYSQSDNMELPSMTISVRATDPDGDLTSYRLQMFVDRVIDGELGEGARDFVFEDVTSSGVCDTDESNLSIDIFIKGGFPSFSTPYEWFFVVEDVAGLPSNMLMETCTTPDENGNPAE